MRAYRKRAFSRLPSAACFLVATCALEVTAFEAKVRFTPSRVVAGERVRYELTITGTDVLPQVSPPFPETFLEASPDDYYTLRSASSNHRGRWSQLAWTAFPQAAGIHRIPSFQIEVDDVAVAVPEAELEVTPSPYTASNALRLELRFPNETSYVGQPIEAFIELTTRPDLGVMLPRRPELGGVDAARGPVGDFIQSERTLNGRVERVFRWPVTLEGFRPGLLGVEASLALRVERDPSSAGPPRVGYGRRNYRDLLVMSEPATHLVSELPNPPEGFRGVIGEWELSSVLDSLSASLEEGFVWTVRMKGEGRLPAESPLALENIENWSISGPRTSRTTNGTDYIFHLQPHSAGWHDLPTVRLVSFDPATESYRDEVLPGAGVVVQAPTTHSADSLAVANRDLAVLPTRGASFGLMDPILWAVVSIFVAAFGFPRMLDLGTRRPQVK